MVDRKLFTRTNFDEYWVIELKQSRFEVISMYDKNKKHINPCCYVPDGEKITIEDFDTAFCWVYYSIK